MPDHRVHFEKQVKLGRNAVAIYQDLVELFGFSNKYNSVKRFVRGLRKEDPRQFDRLEFSPGEEAQVYGTGAKTLHSTGKYRKTRLFRIVHSGRSNQARKHGQNFIIRYFGGCPQYVVLLKEIIKTELNRPCWNITGLLQIRQEFVENAVLRARNSNRNDKIGLKNEDGRNNGQRITEESSDRFVWKIP